MAGKTRPRIGLAELVPAPLPVRSGRPPIGGDSADDNKPLRFVVDPDRRKAYRTAAEREGLSMSAWMRKHLDAAIGADEPKRTRKRKVLAPKCDDCHGTGHLYAKHTGIPGVYVSPDGAPRCHVCDGTGLARPS